MFGTIVINHLSLKYGPSYCTFHQGLFWTGDVIRICKRTRKASQPRYLCKDVAGSYVRNVIYHDNELQASCRKYLDRAVRGPPNATWVHEYISKSCVV